MKTSIVDTTQEPQQIVFTTREAARFLRLTEGTLAGMGRQKRGPRRSKFGRADKSPVRFLLEDLLDFVRDPEGHEARVWGDKKQNTVRAKNPRRR